MIHGSERNTTQVRTPVPSMQSASTSAVALHETQVPDICVVCPEGTGTRRMHRLASDSSSGFSPSPDDCPVQRVGRRECRGWCPSTCLVIVLVLQAIDTK